METIIWITVGAVEGLLLSLIVRKDNDEPASCLKSQDVDFTLMPPQFNVKSDFETFSRHKMENFDRIERRFIRES
jgi:hypothetical protein